MKFKVVSVKNKRWWPRFSRAKTVVLSREHDDPNNWPLYGQVKIDVEDPDVASSFEPGQVYELDLLRID